MDFQKEYSSRLRTAEEAVKIVRDGDWVDYSQTCSFPAALDAALAARRDELRDVKVRNAISMRPVQIVEQDPEQKAFTYNLWHSSGIDRKYLDRGMAYHSPMLFRNCGAYYTKGLAPVDVAMVTVSPMDSHGNFSYGLTNCCMQEMLDSAKHIVLEVNPTMPFVFGTEGDHINIADVDMVVENSEPISTVKGPDATDIDRVIAGNIFPYLRDGITLQLGIGGMPNSLGTLIADSDLKDLGMHTELCSDAYLSMYLEGKLTNRRKTLLPNKGLTGLVTGSQALYDWVDDNPGVVTAPSPMSTTPQS